MWSFVASGASDGTVALDGWCIVSVSSGASDAAFWITAFLGCCIVSGTSDASDAESKRNVVLLQAVCAKSGRNKKASILFVTDCVFVCFWWGGRWQPRRFENNETIPKNNNKSKQCQTRRPGVPAGLLAPCVVMRRRPSSCHCKVVVVWLLSCRRLQRCWRARLEGPACLQDVLCNVYVAPSPHSALFLNVAVMIL